VSQYVPIIAAELSSPQGDRAFTMQETDDFEDAEYEPEQLISNDAQWAIELRSTLLRKAEENVNASTPAVLGMSTPQKQVSSIFSDGAAAKILVSDLLSMMKESSTLGYTVEALDDDIFVWRVRISEVAR